MMATNLMTYVFLCYISSTTLILLSKCLRITSTLILQSYLVSNNKPSSVLKTRSPRKNTTVRKKNKAVREANKTAKKEASSRELLETFYDLLYRSNRNDPPVFVSIDFERLQVLEANFQPAGLSTQTGIAILDTKDFRFSSFLFVTGKTEASYLAEAASKFRQFGEAENIENHELATKIKECLGDYANRRIVLVGHGMSRDLKILELLGSLESSNIVAKIDTFRLGLALKLGKFALRNLVKKVGYPRPGNRHNAGNDAHLALRAMLRLGRLISPHRKANGEFSVSVACYSTIKRWPPSPFSDYGGPWKDKSWKTPRQKEEDRKK